MYEILAVGYNNPFTYSGSAVPDIGITPSFAKLGNPTGLQCLRLGSRTIIVAQEPIVCGYLRISAVCSTRKDIPELRNGTAKLFREKYEGEIR